MLELSRKILETFASPVATIIAAGAAVWVAYKFGSIQAGIAREQAETAKVQKDIAYDRLKYDLFEKRYEVYDAAKRLIEAIFAKTPIDVADPKIRELRLKLDEARFFFRRTRGCSANT